MAGGLDTEIQAARSSGTTVKVFPQEAQPNGIKGSLTETLGPTAQSLLDISISTGMMHNANQTPWELSAKELFDKSVLQYIYLKII